MSGIESHKPIDIAKQKVDNVKNFEGNKNGKIDTYDEVLSLSIFLNENRESLTSNQVDYLEKTIEKGSKEIAKQEDKEIKKLLGDLGKRIEEIIDEDGYVTKGKAEELAAMLGKGILTGFQEGYVVNLLVKSGFESMVKIKDSMPKETENVPQQSIADETVKDNTEKTKETENIPQQSETNETVKSDSKKAANSANDTNKAKTATPRNIKIKRGDYRCGKERAETANFIMQYKEYDDEKKANNVATFLKVNRKEAYGFFKHFKGNYCYRTMIMLKDPNNNIRYDVIKQPITALLEQSTSAGLQNTKEHKAVVKALNMAAKSVRENMNNTDSKIKAGDFNPTVAADLDDSINKLVKLMEKYVTIE